MSILVAFLAFLVALEYLVIAFDIVPRLAGIARVERRTILYARWGATAFLAGCAITHAMIALQTLYPSLRGGMDMDMAADGSDIGLILEMVIPHVAQIIGGAVFIWISKSRLDLSITSKEEAAEQRELHRQLKSAFDLAPLGIAFSSAGNLRGEMYVNPAYLDIFGSAAGASAPSGAALAMAHPADRAALNDTISRVTAGEPVNLEFRLVLADGVIRWIHARWNPVTDVDGAITARAMTIVEDITDRVNAHAALVDSEQRFVQLANSVLVGINLRQLHPPQFLWANAAYRDIVGADPSQDTSTPIDPAFILLHPDDKDRVLSQYWPLAQAGQVAESEHRVLRPDGLVRWVHVTSNPVLDESGTVNRVAGTVEDITDRKNAQAAQAAHLVAERANIAKSEFLSRVSHELRTPMNAVLGFGQLLELDPLTPPQQKAVGHILGAGRHLLSLIDDVLDISRIESDQLDIRLEPVGVAGLVSDVIALMQPLAATGDITVRKDLGLCTAAATSVQADRRRLQQVLLNLLSNAIKYNNPGGIVQIGAATGDLGRLLITVADSGIGIRAEDLPRLFTPFERLGQQSSAIEGTGIGLALTRRLVTEMGGTLDVHSVFGQGSTFTIDLPSVDPAVKLAAA